MSDDSHLDIFGYGKVRIGFPDGGIKRINRVLHIHGLAWILLSMIKLIYASV